MHELDRLLQRNRTFAAAAAPRPSLPEALPAVRAIVIGCADMRVDPAHVCGLELGEAVVIRNIGGRVTPGLIDQLGMLGRIGQVAGEVPGGGDEFLVVVLQHTDCGITRLTGDASMLARYLGVPESQIAAESIDDPVAAVRADVEILRTEAGLPDAWLLAGLVYDVTTGFVDVVAPPRPVSG